MSISLQKGQKVSLSKDGGLKNVIIGLGWDTNTFDTGTSYDLDVQAFMLDLNGKVSKEGDFIFYNNLKHISGSVEHLGDNLTGDGDGDDEQIVMKLDSIPTNIKKIVITITIHNALEKKQNFGQVENSFVRVVNKDTGIEAVKYDLTEDFSVETSVVACEIYNHDGDWKMTAIGSGMKDGLAGLCNLYGVSL